MEHGKESRIELSWMPCLERLTRWTGCSQWVKIPADFRNRSLVAIVSSHSMRHPEWSADWRFCLQDALLQCRDRDQAVLCSDQTPIGFWIQHFAQKLGVPTVRIHRSEDGLTRETPLGCNIVLGPVDQVAASVVETELAELPWIDRVLFALAEHVVAIQVRRGSKTEKLSLKWLESTALDREHHSFYLYSGSSEANSIALANHDHVSLRDCDRAKISAPLVYCQSEMECRCAIRQLARRASDCHAVVISGSVLRASRLSSDQYLLHCTRGRSGAYPLQSDDAYAIEMMLEDQDVRPTPWETLQKILVDRRIAATAFLKKNETPSVSFSNVPILELLSRRHYQPHLQRWDWEPYGIAIRKDSLIAKSAAQPVHYVESVESAADVPEWLVQPQRSKNQKHDWTQEKEWRTPGDVRLSSFDSEEAYIFVPNIRDATYLASISPFPIAVLAEKSN